MMFKNEIFRKGIHLTALLFPVGYLFLPKSAMLILLGSLTLVAFIVEALRLSWQPFARLFQDRVGKLLREHEEKRLTGATYLLVGSFLAILLFDQWIAITVMLFVVISDNFCALIGRCWGKRLIYGSKKTVEGCIAFVITALMIVLLVSRQPLWIGFVGIGVAVFMEIFVIRIDDNVTIPLGAGGIMQLLSNIFS